VNVLLVPAHPGFPGQIPQSRKTVVVVVVVHELVASYKYSSGYILQDICYVGPVYICTVWAKGRAFWRVKN